MKARKFAPLYAAAASLVLLLIAGACIRLSGAAPKILGDSNAPQSAVTGFFDALCEGDYDRCPEYISGYSTIGLNGQPEGEIERMVYAALLDSFSYRLVGDVEQSSEGTYQRVQITAFSVSRLSGDIAARFMPVLEANMAASEDYDALFDENGQYSQQLIDQTLSIILGELLAEPESYYAVTDIAVELEFVKGEWRLIISDELAAVLTGSAGEE